MKDYNTLKICVLAQWNEYASRTITSQTLRPLRVTFWLRTVNACEVLAFRVTQDHLLLQKSKAHMIFY